MKNGWGYEKDNGPSHWYEEFPVAKEGKRQSPIDIQTAKAVLDEKLRAKALKWSYVPENNIDIENTGASFKVNVDGKGSCLSGGPLEGEYELWQFHAHWGKKGGGGSEHTIDGKQWDAELHLVHWNRSKYASPNEAAGQPDGLAVLGIMLTEAKSRLPSFVSSSPLLNQITKSIKSKLPMESSSASGHAEFDKICSLLDKIKYKGDKTAVPKGSIDPAKLLPKDAGKCYWNYEGSLTTPPLLESVIWIVLKGELELSKDQFTKLREMRICSKSDDKGEPSCMVDNFRPPCELGSRVVRKVE